MDLVIAKSLLCFSLLHCIQNVLKYYIKCPHLGPGQLTYSVFTHTGTYARYAVSTRMKMGYPKVFFRMI